MTTSDRTVTQRRRWPPAALLIAIVGVAIVIVWFVQRRQHHVALDAHTITAQLFYISVAPVTPGTRVDGRDAIAVLRLHYSVRNNGSATYVPSSPARLRIVQWELTAQSPAPHGVEFTVPRSIAPVEEREVVVTMPYAAERLPPDEWGRLYPDRDVPPAGDDGKVPRLAVTPATARALMEKNHTQAADLVDRYEIAAGDTPRESTGLGSALLHRKFPRLTGLAVLDAPRGIEIDLPLPRP